MSELTPCPECQRHVRTAETSCPFCGRALSLSHLAAPVLPRSRLSRAATFAFGATLVGATALVGCGGEATGKKEGGGGNSPGGMNAGAMASGGTSGATVSAGNGGGVPDGSGTVPPYGAPPAEDGSGAGGAPSGIGGVGLVAGGDASGSGVGGFVGIPK